MGMGCGTEAQLAQKALVVDDDEQIRELVANVLRAEGYAVTTAANGREALDRIDRDAPPDMIFLDPMLPLMNGKQLRDVLARDEVLAAIRIVPLSATAA